MRILNEDILFESAVVNARLDEISREVDRHNSATAASLRQANFYVEQSGKLARRAMEASTVEEAREAMRQSDSITRDAMAHRGDALVTFEAMTSLLAERDELLGHYPSDDLDERCKLCGAKGQLDFSNHCESCAV